MNSRPHWKQQLVERVRDADRLVVRDHRADPGTGRLVPRQLLETVDQAAIEALIEAIEIDEAASGGHCMCIGSPHFDFCSGPEILASLSLHHGLRLRWPDHWPGDAELTRSSAFAVCGWFTARGIDGPWRELQGEVDRSLAYQRRVMAVQKILPDPFSRRFLSAPDDEHVVELFRESGEDPTTLAAWCLRILGCDHASWGLIDAVTHAYALATKVLPALGRPSCGQALRRTVLADPDRDAHYGAARVLFYFGGWEVFDPKTLNDALPFVIRVSMEHPRRRNRQHVMWVLSRIEGGDVPLRWILSGESTPQPITPAEATEPAGMEYLRGLAPDEPLDSCDQAYAAWLLSRMGASDVRDTIEELTARASARDREVFERALKTLRAEG